MTSRIFKTSCLVLLYISLCAACSPFGEGLDSLQYRGPDGRGDLGAARSDGEAPSSTDASWTIPPDAGQETGRGTDAGDGSDGSPTDAGCSGSERLGTTCSLGGDTCANTGRWRCSDDGRIVCAPAGDASVSEDCNGHDDDCDGTIDEGCPCETEGGKGVCSEGTLDSNGTCTKPEAYSRRETTCDGKDNDCDGETDEGCKCSPGQTKKCFGDDDQLSTSLLSAGPCEQGTRTCKQGGVWADTCRGDVVPKDEVCNGRDDDCDGATDEGCDDDDDGWCDSSMAVEGIPPTCRKGAKEAMGRDCADARADIHPNAAPKEDKTACMKDSDGDGWGDADPSSKQGIPASVQAGSDCDDGKETVHPNAEETCNQKDDDCDGRVDRTSSGERLSRDCTSELSSNPPPKIDSFQEGVCKKHLSDQSSRRVACSSKGSFPACKSLLPPTYASEENPNDTLTHAHCDGQDNDCDGTIDEGCKCTYKTGGTKGVCKKGRIGSGGACRKPSAYEQTEKTWDGLDNDCDGTTDEVIVEVTAGGQHSCARSKKGAVHCWGEDRNDQNLDPRGTFTQISAGRWHTCGIKKGSQKVYCWGLDSSGQASPPNVTFRQISAGQLHTCGVTTNGTLLCWGDKTGSGETLAPVGGSSFETVHSGSIHNCALETNGTIRCWGKNRREQLNKPSTSLQTLAAGGFHNCGITSNSNLRCWGDSADGRTQELSGTFEAITAGYAHTCGIRTDGTADCWGSSRDGRTTVPNKKKAKFKDIDAGWRHTCAVTKEGTLACWGDDGSEQSSPSRALQSSP